TKSAYYENLETLKADETVMIMNPLSSDLNAMRQSLLFGGLEAIARNSNFQNFDLRLFEFGNTYFKRTANSDNLLDKYQEEYKLSLFVTGNKESENWNTPGAKTSFFLLKTYTESILAKLGFSIEKLRVESFKTDLIDEGLVYQRGDGKTIVEVGFVHPKLLKQFDIDNDVFWANFDWDFVLKQLNNNKVSYAELPKFPAVRRDLALLVDEAVTFSQLKQIAMKAERKLLKSVDIFDVYKGDKLPAGKKSYALSFILRDDEKTLNDKVIDQTMNRFIALFEREAGASLR
ncbi:MAG TPA: phenylalanine--tRNA ligase subunit beta, partial [Prolixibacteraceae bacterium]|nr:phenylalanine--tRNA ligase subunit beta [Prolixibacteraceae bacterium]